MQVGKAGKSRFNRFQHVVSLQNTLLPKGNQHEFMQVAVHVKSSTYQLPLTTDPLPLTKYLIEL